ncbi:MAG: glycosyltransferase [Acetobacteraceae bacterium]|nr:glycosyltransferase [Acetobacteraceae bacterium]
MERELIRHWPGPAELVPCRFESADGMLHELPTAVLDLLCTAGDDDARAALLPYLRPLGAALDPKTRTVCAELFVDRARAAYYRGRGGSSAFWLVYDFLPWLRPEWFAAGAANAMMPYVQALRAVPHLAFISTATRRDCTERILRRDCPGPVIPLGADGLGLKPQRFDPARRDFVVLGAIEPRKNVAGVIRAFSQLWAEGVEAGLSIIGVLADDSLEERVLLEELRGERRFRHLSRLPDEGVRESLARARAVLFPSEGEGYGLPPMEALHAGIPVIVWAGLPALHELSGAGQIRLPLANAGAIADAVRCLMDDAAAARLWADTATLHLPTWKDFARAFADWVQGS